MSEENKDILRGKPWKVLKNYKTYEEAYEKVQQLISEDEKIQTKIRRKSDDTFVVKTRFLEVPVSRNEKRKTK